MRHFGVVEHSAELIGCPLTDNNAKLTSLVVVIENFEHSGPMTLCTCLDALMPRAVPHALSESKLHESHRLSDEA
jgi:hypothetical protein